LHICFYNDSQTLGGHEFMTVNIANALAHNNQYKLTYLFYRDDITNLLSHNVKRIKVKYKTRTPFPFVRNFQFRQIFALKNLFCRLDPNLIVISQGNVEFGIKGLIAAKLSKIKTVSYIPFGYSFKESGAKLGLLRDKIDKLYYSLPNGFITSTPYHVSLLKRFITNKKCVEKIVYPIKSLYLGSERNSDLNRHCLNIGIIGRVFFHHKNHPILINVSRILDTWKIKHRVHILGEGPDKLKLIKIIKLSGLEKNFVIHGWYEKNKLLEIVSSLIDIIVIPSNFEGIPLVFLEALAISKPVLISNLGFIRDYSLPHDFLIDNKSPYDIAKKVKCLMNNFDSCIYAQMRNRILCVHSQYNFKEDVLDVFRKLCR